MSKNTGGPAFPKSVRKQENYMDEGGYARTRTINVQEGGMTLRDYFAAKAMVLGWKVFDEAYSPQPLTAENIAKFAYQMADAMLTERGKP